MKKKIVKILIVIAVVLLVSGIFYFLVKNLSSECACFALFGEKCLCQAGSI